MFYRQIFLKKNSAVLYYAILQTCLRTRPKALTHVDEAYFNVASDIWHFWKYILIAFVNVGLNFLCYSNFHIDNKTNATELSSVFSWKTAWM